MVEVPYGARAKGAAGKTDGQVLRVRRQQGGLLTDQRLCHGQQNAVFRLRMTAAPARGWPPEPGGPCRECDRAMLCLPCPYATRCALASGGGRAGERAGARCATQRGHGVSQPVLAFARASPRARLPYPAGGFSGINVHDGRRLRVGMVTGSEQLVLISVCFADSAQPLRTAIRDGRRVCKSCAGRRRV